MARASPLLTAGGMASAPLWGLFARLGQERPSTSVNMGSRRKQAPRIQSDAWHLSVGTAAPPSARGGRRGHNPLVGR